MNQQQTKGISKTSNHQYLVKKYGKQCVDQYFDFDQILNEISDVFCIVCESYVQTQEINRHAESCDGQCDQLEQVDQLQLKLTKCNYLINKIKKMLKSYSTDQQQIIQYLQMLWKCTQEVIISTDPNSVQIYYQDLDLFLAYFEQQEQDIYIQQLISQILTILNKIIQFTDRKLKILQINQTTIINHLKDSIATSLANESCLQKKIINHSQLSRYRNPFENVQNNVHQSLRNTYGKQAPQQRLMKNLLSPIHEQYTKICSPKLEESIQLNQQNQQIQNNLLLPKKQSEDKNQFFKIAQSLKQQFPQKQNVQQALIIALYDQALKCNIKNEDYSDYLYNLYQEL